MKKFLSVILALAMAMSLSVSAFAADFNDVSSSHTNYEAIDTLKTLDIVMAIVLLNTVQMIFLLEHSFVP